MANLPKNVCCRSGTWYVVVRYRDRFGKRRSIWRRCEKNMESVKQVRWAIDEELLDMRARETFADLLFKLFRLMSYGNTTVQG